MLQNFSKWQAIHETFTLCCLNFTFWKLPEHSEKDLRAILYARDLILWLWKKIILDWYSRKYDFVEDSLLGILHVIFRTEVTFQFSCHIPFWKSGQRILMNCVRWLQIPISIHFNQQPSKLVWVLAIVWENSHIFHEGDQHWVQFECGRQGRVFTKIQRSTLANIWPWQQNKVLESDTLDLDKSIYQ